MIKRIHSRIGPAMIGIAAAALLCGVGGPTAMASSSVTTETAHGVLHGAAAAANVSVIPLAWQGLVDTHGTFTPPSSPPKKGALVAFPTSAGKVTIELTAPSDANGNFNPKTCYAAYTVNVVFAVVGGKSTGKFAGASGTGTGKFYGAGYSPRYTSGPHKGQCNTSPNAPTLPNGAVEGFQLSADLRL
jgi:hypothetical protein